MKWFVCVFHFNGWDHVSLGIHIDWRNPNIELHVPFGFFRVGWMHVWTHDETKLFRTFGFTPRG